MWQNEQMCRQENAGCEVWLQGKYLHLVGGSRKNVSEGWEWEDQIGSRLKPI